MYHLLQCNQPALQLYLDISKNIVASPEGKIHQESPSRKSCFPSIWFIGGGRCNKPSSKSWPHDFGSIFRRLRQCINSWHDFRCKLQDSPELSPYPHKNPSVALIQVGIVFYSMSHPEDITKKMNVAVDVLVVNQLIKCSELKDWKGCTHYDPKFVTGLHFGQDGIA